MEERPLRKRHPYLEKESLLTGLLKKKLKVASFEVVASAAFLGKLGLEEIMAKRLFDPKWVELEAELYKIDSSLRGIVKRLETMNYKSKSPKPVE